MGVFEVDGTTKRCDNVVQEEMQDATIQCADSDMKKRIDAEDIDLTEKVKKYEEFLRVMCYAKKEDFAELRKQANYLLKGNRGEIDYSKVLR